MRHELQLRGTAEVVEPGAECLTYLGATLFMTTCLNVESFLNGVIVFCFLAEATGTVFVLFSFILPRHLCKRDNSTR